VQTIAYEITVTAIALQSDAYAVYDDAENRSRTANFERNDCLLVADVPTAYDAGLCEVVESPSRM
jgi:hypothetical protein